MKAILILPLILISSLSFSQKQVLENYDFSKNEYKLFVNHYYNEGESEISIFSVLYNSSRLDSLKRNWIGEETMEELRCGYDFTLYLIKSDSIVNVFNVNTECGQVCMNEKTINYIGNPLLHLKTDAKVYEKRLKYNSLDSARKALNRLSNTKGYYIPEKDDYEWSLYDGYFGLKKSFTLETRDSAVEEANRMVFNQKLNDITRVELKGVSPDYFFFKIYCNYEYYMNCKETEKTKWNPFIKEDEFNIYVFSENEDLLIEK